MPPFRVLQFTQLYVIGIDLRQLINQLRQPEDQFRPGNPVGRDQVGFHQ